MDEAAEATEGVIGDSWRHIGHSAHRRTHASSKIGLRHPCVTHEGLPVEAGAFEAHVYPLSMREVHLVQVRPISNVNKIRVKYENM